MQNNARRGRSGRRFLTISFLLLFLLHSLSGSIIILKNGDKIRGTILSQDLENIVVKTLIGNLTIAKDKISSIEIERPTTEYVIVYLKNNLVVEGWVVDNKPDAIILKTSLGTLSIIKKEIARMQWEKREQPPEKTATTAPGTQDATPPKSTSITTNRPPQKKPDRTLVSTNRTPPKTAGRFVPPDIGLQSMWRSLLIPSWGQFHQGKTTKGAVIAGLAGAGLAGTLFSYSKYSSARKIWEATPTKDHYDQVARWGKTCNIFLVFYLSVWAYNAVDALIFAPAPTGKQAAMAITPFWADGSTGVVLNARF